MPDDPRGFGPLVKELPAGGSVAALMSLGLSAAVTDTSACVSANAVMPYKGRMLVAAAATTIPLLRFFLNLVVFLFEEKWKPQAGIARDRVQQIAPHRVSDSFSSYGCDLGWLLASRSSASAGSSGWSSDENR
ncbi:hypothetical protein [Streptomyces deserti]